MIRETADASLKYLRYLRTRCDEKGLLSIGLGDWCHVVIGKPKAPLIVTDTIISMDFANKLAFMLDAIDRKEDADFARSEAEKYKEAFRKELVDNAMWVQGNCQTCQAMALHYGLFEPEEEQQAFQRLLEMIREQEDFMDVGVLGGKVLFHVLTKFGYTDLALKLMTRPEYPSYGNWVAQGATSLWEDFMEDPASMNHHFWGDISAWFIKTLAGICYNPKGNDWKQVDICPHFPAEMKDASAWFDSNHGKIESNWVREGEKIRLAVTVPEGMHGTLSLEPGWVLENGAVSCPAASGTYVIRMR